MRTGFKIRQDFIEYFETQKHTIVPSSSLVPIKDPSLLFTNSGMVQFKDIFLGNEIPLHKRVANSQKCIRVAGKHNDLDDVGRDGTHHTFFEMLGNWSFGDYYKKEAISMAWYLLTNTWQIPPEHLYATVFKDEQDKIDADEEAATIWREQPGFIKNNLFYKGRHDNFWEMADTGPCGPCSEIHIDLYPNKGPVNSQVIDSNRFVELWNLVFIQYNRINNKTLENLPTSHVDTGMGLERITSILQKSKSNYHTDLFWPTILATQKLTKHNDKQRDELFTPYRVIADHVRAATFLIADGVNPGNTNRNYICRMIIRRASRFASEIGLKSPCLSKISESIITNYKKAYPELDTNSNIIYNTIETEELTFQKTINSGISHLNTLIKQANNNKKTSLTGEQTFDLYATYGLPVEITKDICNTHGLEVDQTGFHKAMKTHREASKNMSISSQSLNSDHEIYINLLDTLIDKNLLTGTNKEHEPYQTTSANCKILAIISNDGQLITESKPGDSIQIVLSNSPFYIESGGQTGDTGSIVSTKLNWNISIQRAHQPIPGLIVHSGTVNSGYPNTLQQCTVSVHKSNRLSIMRNHTATHLLHQELKSLLGNHVRQAGSSITEDRLRFDFLHNKALTPEQLKTLTININNIILNNNAVKTNTTSYDKALAQGAIALFGEKYGDIVRTVEITDNDSKTYSLELCGGTHVNTTGELGIFLIINESSISSNTRRIEAITGKSSLDHTLNTLSITDTIKKELNTDTNSITQKIKELHSNNIQLQSQVDSVQLELMQNKLNTEIENIEIIENTPVLITRIDNQSTNLIRKITDKFIEQQPNGIIIIGSKIDTNAHLIVRIGKQNANGKLNAGKIVKDLSGIIEGKGGGNSTLGQGGGNKPKLLDVALQTASELITQILSETK